MSQETAKKLNPSTVNNAPRCPVKKLTYQPPAKNAQALTQVTAWLKAASVSVRPSNIPGCDLTVLSKAGAAVQIKVAANFNDPRPAAEHLFILAADLTSRHSDIALKAFQQITTATGHGALAKPIDRGVDPAKKLSFEDNFELVAMRHTEFRKVPNPTNEDLTQYQQVIRKAVARCLYINTKICRMLGLQYEDLQTYAQVWACNYLGLYKVANPTNNDNERKLYAHLCQRFANFIEILLKKGRSCLPDTDTVSIALRGMAWECNGDTRRRWDDAGEVTFEDAATDAIEAEVVEPEYDESFEPELMMDAATAAQEEQREQKISDNKRRRLAQAALRAEFAKMDHETLLSVLAEAQENTYICYDARKEAQKQLRLHRASCPSCIKVQEDLAAANLGGS